MKHRESHRTTRIGWLRAAVLGANDGIVSTASLITGVAAAHSDRHQILISGIAGLIGGALSMAAGEYVSVSSQADTEQADLVQERREIAADPAHERQELAEIYMSRGLEKNLADKVAEQMMKHDPLEAHAREELGISKILTAKPIQAALSSAASFAMGAALPLLVAIFVPETIIVSSVFIASFGFLVGLGALAAYTGGASLTKGAARVAFWGAFAMGVTVAIGSLFGAQI